MPSQASPEDRRRDLLRARRLIRIAFVAFATAVLGGVVVIISDPVKWPLFASGTAVCLFAVLMNVSRLRIVNRALRRIDAELLRQPDGATGFRPPG